MFKIFLKSFLYTVVALIGIILLLAIINGDPVFCLVASFGLVIIFIIFLCTFLIIDKIGK